jgi:transketolase C-terminal domain/subunit
MQIILKKKIMTDVGDIEKGTVLDVPVEIAQRWIEQGKAKAVIETTTVKPSEKRRR